MKLLVTLVPPEGSIVAGDHVPVIPSMEVVGKVAAGSVSHKGPTFEKVGVVAGVTTTVIVADVAHWPASGVKVAVTFDPPAG